MHVGNLSDFAPTIFVMAPGAFFVLATIIAVMAKIIDNMEKKKGERLPVKHMDEDGIDCATCSARASCSGKVSST